MTCTSQATCLLNVWSLTFPFHAAGIANGGLNGLHPEPHSSAAAVMECGNGEVSSASSPASHASRIWINDGDVSTQDIIFPLLGMSRL
jgi:hypothetical protein